MSLLNDFNQWIFQAYLFIYLFLYNFILPMTESGDELYAL